MSEIVGGTIGPEASWDLSITGGKVVVSVNYNGQQAGASLSASVDAIQFLEKLKTLIPGSIDDMIISLAEAAIKGQG